MSNPRTPAYFECIGLPGSGKTTLVDAIATLQEAPSIGTREAFREKTVLRSTKARKATRQARLFARHPSLFKLVAPLAQLSWPNQGTLEETTALLLELSTARDALDHGPPTIFFDEGPCQRIFSIALTQPHPLPPDAVDALIATILDVLGTLHIVHLRIPPEDAALRIQDRPEGWKRWDNDDPLPNRLLYEHERTFDQIHEACNAHGIPVTELDAKAPIDTNRDTILPHLTIPPRML